MTNWCLFWINWGYKWFYSSGEIWVYQERRQKQREFTVGTNNKGMFWPQTVCMDVWHKLGYDSIESIKINHQEIHWRWEIKNTHWFDVLNHPTAWSSSKGAEWLLSMWVRTGQNLQLLISSTLGYLLCIVLNEFCIFTPLASTPTFHSLSSHINNILL